MEPRRHLGASQVTPSISSSSNIDPSKILQAYLHAKMVYRHGATPITPTILNNNPFIVKSIGVIGVIGGWIGDLTSTFPELTTQFTWKRCKPQLGFGIFWLWRKWRNKSNKIHITIYIYMVNQKRSWYILISPFSSVENNTTSFHYWFYHQVSVTLISHIAMNSILHVSVNICHIKSKLGCSSFRGQFWHTPDFRYSRMSRRGGFLGTSCHPCQCVARVQKNNAVDRTHHQGKEASTKKELEEWFFGQTQE